LEYKSAHDIWDAVLGELQVQISKSNYKTWLEKTQGLSYQNNQFVVGTPNTFVAEYLDKNQRSLIEKTLIGVLHHEIELVFRVDGVQRSRPYTAVGQPEMPALNTNFTFNSFVVGNNNQLAYAAALEIMDKPGSSYNPLLICGASGLGKTHLLQAIGHQALNKNMKVLYASGEQYTNEFINAIKERRTEEFRNKYRNSEMLLIDDINFIIGKEQTEESLFHTLNELHNANRQIAVTSDCPPQAMPQISEKLRSRLEGGLVANIQSPDFDTRLHILEIKTKQKGVDISADTLELIAQNIRQNIRELEGSLNRVIAYARLMHDSITPELATRALEDISGRNHNEKSFRFTPQLLVETVADTFQLSPADLRGKRRDKETALARQMAMYVMKQEMNCSLAQIGQEFGKRDPSTVTHACQKIAGDLTSNTYLKDKLSAIQERINKTNLSR
jgi:chromosomal replication initiator protein